MVDLRERIDGRELSAGHRLLSEQDPGENRLVVIRGRGTYVPR